MLKISYLKIGAISFGSLLISQGAIAKKGTKPNLLFIMTDQQRFDALSIGKILFEYINFEYKTRLSSSLLLAVLKNLKDSK